VRETLTLRKKAASDGIDLKEIACMVLLYEIQKEMAKRIRSDERSF